jgi:hypothetical protein
MTDKNLLLLHATSLTTIERISDLISCYCYSDKKAFDLCYENALRNIKFLKKNFYAILKTEVSND